MRKGGFVAAFAVNWVATAYIFSVFLDVQSDTKITTTKI